jgi:hypothetical protein
MRRCNRLVDITYRGSNLTLNGPVSALVTVPVVTADRREVQRT